MRSIQAIVAFGLASALALPSTAAAADPFATEVSSGPYHNCMVTSCGAVQCWGRNDHGQANDRAAPSPFVYGDHPYESVSVGQFHSCALDSMGQIECWGRSNYNQTAAPAGTFVQMDAGFNHNCAIDTDGNIVCWGADDQEQVTGAPAGKFVQVTAGRLHSCAITDPAPGALAEVICWGSDSHGQAHGGTTIDQYDLWWVGTGEEIVEVVAGGYHTCARSDRWATYCWGMDTYGATASNFNAIPSNDPSLNFISWIRPLDLGAGTWGTCMVRLPSGDTTYDEEFACWGSPFEGSSPAPNVIPQQVSVGSSHACFLGDDDLVECWGSVQYGKLDVPTVDQCPGFLEPLPPPQLPTWPW
ncbi:MAG: hypothetical protein K0V04_22500 [Deltaproteobacteria bacterium]|nr:hypothetical protein [Deltaproteobacteria bacterium]